MNRDQAMAVVDLAEAADPSMSGSDDVPAAALRAAADQIVPAIQFLIETDRAAALRLVGVLPDYWQESGRVDEGRALTERALEGSNAAGDRAVAAVIAAALLAASDLAFLQGDEEGAKKRANDCIRAAILVEDRVTASLAHSTLAKLAHRDGDAAEMERHSRKALELAGDDAVANRRARMATDSADGADPASPANAAPAMRAPRGDCCPDTRIASHFDNMTRQRTEGGTVLPAMVAVTERLLAQLDDVGHARPSVLELGCGSAALLVNLLTRGATSADGVDLSPEAIATAQRRAADAGVGERAHFELGDAARATYAAHDWVILDRAICCYSDMPGLLGAALSASPSRIALSVPTSRGLPGLANKVMWGLESFLTRFQKDECPGYVHSLDDIERRLSWAGFHRRSSDSTLLWYTAVWDRPAA